MFKRRSWSNRLLGERLSLQRKDQGGEKLQGPPLRLGEVGREEKLSHLLGGKSGVGGGLQ